MVKYKHIIWDWNGTLLNDLELCKNLINEILYQNSLPGLSVEKYKEIFTFPVKDYYKKAGLDLSGNNFEIMGKAFIKNYENRRAEAPLHKDAEKVLDYFDFQGISQSVLSAYYQITLEEIIAQFNLQKYFVKLNGLDNIYASSKLENGKKWMQELSANNIEANKGEVLLIGDTLHDLEVADAIGAEAILISHGHQSAERLKASGTKVISTLTELLEL